MPTTIPYKFWIDLNKDVAHNAEDGASYHIQHVVRNPTKYGFKEGPEGHEEMKKYTKANIHDIHTGWRDVDYDLEGEVMKRGFIRGYHMGSGRKYGNVRFDAHDDQHLKKALELFLPHQEEAEAKGNNLTIEAQVGDKAAYESPSNWNHSYDPVTPRDALIKDHVFTTSKETKEHLKKTSGGIKLKTPETVSSMGMTEPLRAQIKKQKVKSGVPKFEAERQVGQLAGTWGDSMEYKSFKQLFSEKLSATAAIRRAGSPTVEKRVKQIGGEVIAGGIARGAGLTGSQLGTVKEKITKGGNLPPNVAQKIAKSALSDK